MAETDIWRLVANTFSVTGLVCDNFIFRVQDFDELKGHNQSKFSDRMEQYWLTYHIIIPFSKLLPCLLKRPYPGFRSKYPKLWNEIRDQIIQNIHVLNLFDTASGIWQYFWLNDPIFIPPHPMIHRIWRGKKVTIRFYGLTRYAQPAYRRFLTNCKESTK